jgi:hypothetical protein
MMSYPLAQTSTVGVPLLWAPASVLLGLILLGGVIWLLLRWQLPRKAVSTIPFEWQPSFTPYEQGYRPFSSVNALPEREEQSYDVSGSWEEQPQAHYPVLPPNPTSWQE